MNSLVPRREDFFFPIEQAFDRFFEDFFKDTSPMSVGRSGGFPKLNAYETDDELVVTASVAGMRKDDIRVEVLPNNILMLSGRLAEEHIPPKNAKVGVRELRASTFERQLRLPEYVLGDPAALLKDGILTLRWAIQKQRDARAETRFIEVKEE